MAYHPRNLSVLVYSNGFTLWHYTSTDAAAEIDSSGYFGAASDMLRVGDMILASADTAGAPGAGIFLVNANDGDTVGVTNLTSVGAFGD